MTSSPRVFPARASTRRAFLACRLPLVGLLALGSTLAQANDKLTFLTS